MAGPEPSRPLPAPTPTSAPYWDALRREELHLQRCTRCAHWVHYPRVRCPQCFSPDLAWHRVDPRGTVYAYTVTHRPTAPMFAEDVPQAIAIVELTNGVRMTTTLVLAEDDRPRVGDPVRGVFDHVNDDITLLRFEVLAGRE
jgi:uncharacterized OB-fold protein